jgi:hypothetical protein
MTTVPASDKHYTARIIERKDLSEDLWLIRVVYFIPPKEAAAE